MTVRAEGHREDNQNQAGGYPPLNSAMRKPVAIASLVNVLKPGSSEAFLSTDRICHEDYDDESLHGHGLACGGASTALCRITTSLVQKGLDLAKKYVSRAGAPNMTSTLFVNAGGYYVEQGNNRVSYMPPILGESGVNWAAKDAILPHNALGDTPDERLDIYDLNDLLSRLLR